MSYRCLATSRFGHGSYELVPYREQDILLVKQWRNEQIDVLRQARPLSDEDQKRYYETFVKPTFSEAEPRVVLFSYLYAGECIGYGGLTNVDWQARRAELSFLVATQRAGKAPQYAEDFSNFLQLVKQAAFEGANLNRLFTETFDVRPAHVALLEQAGFKLEGRLRQHARVGQRLVDSLVHGLLRSDGAEPSNA